MLQSYPRDAAMSNATLRGRLDPSDSGLGMCRMMDRTPGLFGCMCVDCDDWPCSAERFSRPLPGLLILPSNNRESMFRLQSENNLVLAKENDPLSEFPLVSYVLRGRRACSHGFMRSDASASTEFLA